MLGRGPRAICAPGEDRIARPAACSRIFVRREFLRAIPTVSRGSRRPSARLLGPRVNEARDQLGDDLVTRLSSRPVRRWRDSTAGPIATTASTSIERVEARSGPDLGRRRRSRPTTRSAPTSAVPLGLAFMTRHLRCRPRYRGGAYIPSASTARGTALGPARYKRDLRAVRERQVGSRPFPRMC
jgi:hypothetical protein